MYDLPTRRAESPVLAILIDFAGLVGVVCFWEKRRGDEICAKTNDSSRRISSVDEAVASIVSYGLDVVLRRSIPGYGAVSGNQSSGQVGRVPVPVLYEISLANAR